MKPQIISLKRITDPRGNLTVAEPWIDLPFELKRAYWIYDVPGGECRGSHAHKESLSFIIAISGSFSVVLENGKDKCTYFLNHPYEGLLVPNGLWRTLIDFSSGAVCLVLTSSPFDENDYIRDYTEYLAYPHKGEM